MKKFTKEQSSEIRHFYFEHGFVIIKDALVPDALNQLRDEIKAVFLAKFPEEKETNAWELMISDKYITDKSKWRECASKLWDLFGVANITSSREIKKILYDIGLKMPSFSTRTEVRMDMPGDELYMQPWHQDWPYGQTSLNAVTLWIPLVPVNKENGTICIIPKSHKYGYVDTIQLDNPRRLEIKNKELLDDTIIDVELAVGEIVVFSQFLLHKSGYNRTNYPRLSFQGRYADLLEPSYIERGYKDYFRNGNQDYRPSKEEIQTIFELK